MLALMTTTAVADPIVEVFTDHAHPLTNTQAFPSAAVFYVDGLTRAMAELSEGLPADPTAATAMAKARFDERTDLKAQMREAGNGLALAHQHYRLDRYPAIVFDGAAVLYGVTDLVLARDLYRKMNR